MSDLPESEDEWKDILSEEEYKILRESGTEPKFSGELLDNKSEGVYKCAGCGNELFSSDSKFDSGSGWPSFYETLNSEHIDTRIDRSHGTNRSYMFPM